MCLSNNCKIHTINVCKTVLHPSTTLVLVGVHNGFSKQVKLLIDKTLLTSCHSCISNKIVFSHLYIDEFDKMEGMMWMKFNDISEIDI